MRPILTTLCFFLNCFCYGQTITIEKAQHRLSTIFKDHDARAEVLLVGTFHFAYPNLDGHTTPDSLRIDILSKERQREIARVVSLLKAFRPTKIGIEVLSQNQKKYDSLFQKYLTDNLLRERNESFQLGFRMAKELKHSRIYCIDAKPFVKTLYELDSTRATKYNLKNDNTFEELEAKYEQFYSYDDTLQKSMELKDYLLFTNSDKYLQYDNGQYLLWTRNGTNLEPIGADGFVSKWFNRNARIFSNIQRICTDKNERILVIIGGSHVPMLKFLLESSQEFKLRRIEEFLK